MSLLRTLIALIALLLVLAPAAAMAQDNDGDGRTAGALDCDDNDPTIYLNAPEVCDDGIDQSCSGADLLSDGDSDGWTDFRCFTDVDCAANPEDPACDAENFDCNDSDADLNRDDADGDGFSTCDDDCDDTDGAIDPVDDDGDGFDECDGGDCDDTDADLSPTGVEVCGDSADNDCDGTVDNVDLDGDGAISPDCGGEDCDDNDASLNPTVPEDGATCNDRIDNDCDEVADNLDSDCFESPEVDAGVDIQDRYLGGTIVVALDGSGTTDFNAEDELTYTWTVEHTGGGSDGVIELTSDPTRAYAYLSFRAPGSESTEWTYDATLSVSDGNPETDDDSATISVRFWRPNYVPPKSCSQTAPVGPSSALALLLLLGATATRRRRGALHG